MAIILIKNGEKIYENQTGIVTEYEREKADRLDASLKVDIQNLEESWFKYGALSRSGIKKDTLKIWYDLGKLLNNIIDRFKIRGTDEEVYYWQAIYNYVSKKVQKNPPPKKYKDRLHNHFRLCAKMAERNWNEVQQVGNWSIWRDLFDNSKLMEDERVFDWVVDVIKALKLGHKELRPFIHAVRRRLKKIDTSMLNIEELHSKLDQVKPIKKFNEKNKCQK